MEGRRPSKPAGKWPFTVSLALKPWRGGRKVWRTLKDVEESPKRKFFFRDVNKKTRRERSKKVRKG